MSRRPWLHGVLAEARVTLPTFAGVRGAHQISVLDGSGCERLELLGLRLRWLCQIVRVGFTGTFLHEFRQSPASCCWTCRGAPSLRAKVRGER